MKRRNDYEYRKSQLKTALQWSKLGMLPNDFQNGGVLLYTNGFHHMICRYYDENEVHLATNDEMYDFMKPYIERKRNYDKRRRERVRGKKYRSRFGEKREKRQKDYFHKL